MECPAEPERCERLLRVRALEQALAGRDARAPAGRGGAGASSTRGVIVTLWARKSGQQLRLEDALLSQGGLKRRTGAGSCSVGPLHGQRSRLLLSRASPASLARAGSRSPSRNLSGNSPRAVLNLIDPGASWNSEVGALSVGSA